VEGDCSASFSHCKFQFYFLVSGFTRRLLATALVMDNVKGCGVVLRYARKDGS